MNPTPLFANYALYYWHLPLLIVVVSLVYSATRFDHWEPILHETGLWVVRMSVFLFVIALILYVLATFIMSS